MTRPSIRHLLLPLLALGVGLATAAPAQAQTRSYVQVGTSSPSMSMQISFGTQPQWVPIYGTGIREIRAPYRPAYDMFNYGGVYYVCDNDRWYSSRRSTGRFTYIETRAVPVQFSRIPRHHWRHYPNTWTSRNGNGRQGNQGHQGRGRGPDGNGPPGQHKHD